MKFRSVSACLQICACMKPFVRAQQLRTMISRKTDSFFSPRNWSLRSWSVRVLQANSLMPEMNLPLDHQPCQPFSSPGTTVLTCHKEGFRFPLLGLTLNETSFLQDPVYSQSIWVT